MATLPRRQPDPEHVRIADLLRQGFLVLAPDKSLIVTFKGLAVLMAEAEPPQKPPPKRVRISGG